jgi:hypothetical protein
MSPECGFVFPVWFSKDHHLFLAIHRAAIDDHTPDLHPPQTQIDMITREQLDGFLLHNASFAAL